MYIGCIYRHVYLYWQWSEKGLRVSIGLQNKRLALKSRKPPSCSGQSSLALEYSLTHLALACLSIRYVMYPGSTLTSCNALFLLLSFLRLSSFLSHSFVRCGTWPSHAGKENKGAVPSPQSVLLKHVCIWVKIVHPIESCVPRLSGFSWRLFSYILVKMLPSNLLCIKFLYQW